MNTTGCRPLHRGRRVARAQPRGLVHGAARPGTRRGPHSRSAPERRRRTSPFPCPSRAIGAPTLPPPSLFPRPRADQTSTLISRAQARRRRARRAGSRVVAFANTSPRARPRGRARLAPIDRAPSRRQRANLARPGHAPRRGAQRARRRVGSELGLRFGAAGVRRPFYTRRSNEPRRGRARASRVPWVRSRRRLYSLVVEARCASEAGRVS